MGVADLTAFNDAGRDTVYAGAIIGDGQLAKTGEGELARIRNDPPGPATPPSPRAR